MKMERESTPIVSAKSFNKEQAAAYLAALIDGEGCVYFRKVILPSGRHHQARIVTITNTEPALIEAAADCMNILGIEFALYDRPGATDNRRHRWTIDIRKGAAMWRLRELVPILAPEKRARLDDALITYRGLHCHGCGCLHDEQTTGCINCRKRHGVRASAVRYRERKKAAA